MPTSVPVLAMEACRQQTRPEANEWNRAEMREEMGRGVRQAGSQVRLQGFPDGSARFWVCVDGTIWMILSCELARIKQGPISIGGWGELRYSAAQAVIGLGCRCQRGGMALNRTGAAWSAEFRGGVSESSAPTCGRILLPKLWT